MALPTSGIGASLVAVLAALTGKYLSGIVLIIPGPGTSPRVKIAGSVAFISAFIGMFSHVLMDRIMHGDGEPFFPVDLANPFPGLISVSALHKVCLYTGLVSAGVSFSGNWYLNRKSSDQALRPGRNTCT